MIPASECCTFRTGNNILRVVVDDWPLNNKFNDIQVPHTSIYNCSIRISITFVFTRLIMRAHLSWCETVSLSSARCSHFNEVAFLPVSSLSVYMTDHIIISEAHSHTAAWWRTLAALLTFCVGLSSLRDSNAESLAVLFVVRLNKLLNKHSHIFRFETP